MAKRSPLPRVPEKAVQQQIVALLRSVGSKVYVLGTRRGRHERDHGTHQTPGFPDLFAFVPDRSGVAGYIPLFVEVKGAGGRLRPEQREFQGYCIESRGLVHITGGYDLVVQYLVAIGLVKPENVPHYRRAEARS